MNRIKKRSVGTYTFTATAENEDGVAQTIVAPVTVTIRDGAGTTVVTDTPTISAGKLVYDCNAALLDTLDIYEITWTGVVGGESQAWVTEVEIVGGYLFEIADLRKQDRAFADTTKYPTETLREIRYWVEDVIEGSRAAQVAFVPRGRRVKVSGSSPDLRLGYNPLLYGTDYRGLQLPDFNIREVYSLTINDYTLTAEELAEVRIDDNWLYRTAGVQWPAWPTGNRNISVYYEHGFDRAPGAITRAALMLAREYLVKSDLPGRATATSIGDQMFRLTIAGRDGVTGIPEVDAAIDQFGRKGYGLG